MNDFRLKKNGKEHILTGYYLLAYAYADAVRLGDKKTVDLYDAEEETYRNVFYSLYDPDGKFIGSDIDSDDLNNLLDAMRAIDKEAKADCEAGRTKTREEAKAFVATLGLKDDAGC